MANRYNKSHGLSRTRLYRIYNNMKSRCYKPYAKEYENYGGRGITICDEWLGNNGFMNFYNWSMENGYDEKLTIDRIDNDKNYEPDNCRWVTSFVQNNNSRHAILIEFNGEKHTVAQWSKIKGISRNTLVKRIRMGWSIEKVLTTPVNHNFSRK